MLSKLINATTAVLVAVFLAMAPAAAAERGTLDEAKAMAEKAAAFLKAEGRDKALAAFNGDAQFKDRDLYVFALSPDGTNIAHGVNPALVGKNLMALRDPTGKQFVKEMAEVTDKGWVDYSWQNPTTKAVEPKRSYVIRQGDVVLGVGAYVK